MPGPDYYAAVDDRFPDKPKADEFTRSTAPRHLRVAQADPTRLIEHDSLESHFASAPCLACTTDPPTPTWGMVEELEATAEGLSNALKEEKAKNGDGAETFMEVREERDWLSEEREELIRIIKAQDRRLAEVRKARRPWFRSQKEEA